MWLPCISVGGTWSTCTVCKQNVFPEGGISPSSPYSSNGCVWAAAGQSSFPASRPWFMFAPAAHILHWNKCLPQWKPTNTAARLTAPNRITNSPVSLLALIRCRAGLKCRPQGHRIDHQRMLSVIWDSSLSLIDQKLFFYKNILHAWYNRRCLGCRETLIECRINATISLVNPAFPSRHMCGFL